RNRGIRGTKHQGRPRGGTPEDQPVIPIVFDCGVLVSAIGWMGNPRHCLRLVAERQIRLCATEAVWEEYETRIPEVLADKRPGVQVRPTLDWLLSVAHFVNPLPL